MTKTQLIRWAQTRNWWPEFVRNFSVSFANNTTWRMNVEDLHDYLDKIDQPDHLIRCAFSWPGVHNGNRWARRCDFINVMTNNEFDDE